MGSPTVASQYLGEHHTTRPPRQSLSHSPSKEKTCPHAFRARRSHWSPNVTVGRISDTL